MKAKVAVVGLGVLMSTAGFGAMTQAKAAVISIPAPPSASNAVAVKVGNLVSVGQTGASSSKTGSSATAAPITLGGKPLLAGVKDATKSGSGAALDTGNTQLGRLAVAPWSTNVATDHASANSALATAALNGVGDVTVANSYSFADWTPGRSHSSSVSDGAILHFGQYTIKVLHAESDASGTGKTYLVQLFGKNIAVTDSKGCLLGLGPVANVGCLSALSGVGSDAEVAQALIGSNAPFAKVIAAAATGGAAKVVEQSTSVQGAELTRATSTSSGLMARTGTNALMMVAIGMLLIAAGMTFRFTSRELAVVPSHNG